MLSARVSPVMRLSVGVVVVRLLGRSVAVGVLVLLSLGLAVPANAVDAPPPPIVDIPDLPSRTAKGGWAEGKVLEMWRAILHAAQNPSVLNPPPVPGKELVHVPKPITAATAPTRAAAVGNPAGAAITGFGVGWAIGQGGLAAYAAATGTSYESMVCGNEWYAGVNNFIMLGTGPSCSAEVVLPNPDGGMMYTSLRGATLTLSGSGKPGSWGTTTNTQVCWTGARPVLQTGEAWQTQQLNGSWVVGGLPGSGTGQLSACTNTNNTGLGLPATYAGVYSSTTYNIPPVFRIVVTATGQVLTETTSTPANPVRTPSCSIAWRDGTTTTGPGEPYDELAGFPVSAEGLGCSVAWNAKPGAGSSVMPSRIDVDSKNADGSDTRVLTSEVPDYSPQEVESLNGDLSNGRGLVLERIGSEGGECNNWQADCSGWWSTSSSGTNNDLYRCSFGGRSVALTECGPYRNTFDTQTSTPTITDPSTGGQVNWGTRPSTGNSINPGTGPGTSPGDQCMASWSATINPIEWVLHPVKCAMVWAFVPRTAVVTATQTAIATAWGTTMPGRLPGIVSAALVVPGDPGGCMGPHVYMPFSTVNASWPDFDAYPLSACAAPASTVAAWARTIGAAVMIYLTALGIIRRASSTVNAPGLGGGSA